MSRERTEATLFKNNTFQCQIASYLTQTNWMNALLDNWRCFLCIRYIWYIHAV